MKDAKLIAIFAMVALIPLFFATGYVLGDAHARPQEKAAVNWIYGPRLSIPTNEKGIVVLCQEKTNSPQFRDHKYARAGDVDTMTCRAVKAKKLKSFGPEPKS